MTFAEAEEKLKSISPGFRTIYYDKTTDDSGNVKTRCWIYTHKENTIDQGNTWEEAFAARAARIKPASIQEPPE